MREAGCERRDTRGGMRDVRGMMPEVGFRTRCVSSPRF